MSKILIKNKNIDIIWLNACNKKKTLGTELFLRGRKLNISLAVISKSYFVLPQNIIILPITLLWEFQTNF